MTANMSQVGIYPEMEVRKLKPAELYTLGQILNISDSWKKLMAIIPKEGTDNFPKFNSDHFSIIEQAAQRQRRNAAEIFLEEWGTMGKNRPTLQSLLDFLVKAELFRAADYVAVDLLKDELPKRPEHGPAARIEISEETIRKLLEEQALYDYSATEEPILGSSLELNLNEIVYAPEASLNAEKNNSLRADTRSTKLASELDDIPQSPQKLGDNKPQESSKQKIKENSDLIKFSTSEIGNVECDSSAEQNSNVNGDKTIFEQKNIRIEPLVECKSELLPLCVNEKQEMPSEELPAFLNEFGKSNSSVQTEKSHELNSDGSSLVLDKSSQMSSKNIANDKSLNSNTSCSESCNYALYKDFNNQEMKSAELPEFVAHLNSDTKTRNLGCDINPLASQELPITVQEYH